MLHDVCLRKQQTFAAFAVVPRFSALLSNTATRLFVFDDCFGEARAKQLMLFHLLFWQVELLLVKGGDDVGATRRNILRIVTHVWIERIRRGRPLSQRKSGLLTLNLLIWNLHLWCLLLGQESLFLYGLMLRICTNWISGRKERFFRWHSFCDGYLRFGGLLEQFGGKRHLFHPLLLFLLNFVYNVLILLELIAKHGLCDVFTQNVCQTFIVKICLLPILYRQMLQIFLQNAT